MTEHQAGRWDVAKPLYEQILARDPSFARAWHVLGLVLHQTGDSATGIQYIERAIALEPHWPVFYANLCSIHWTGARRMEAEAVLRRGIKMSPEHPAHWMMLGQLLCEEDRCDEALEVFQHVLTENPSDVAAWASFGLACNELGRIHDAIAAYTRAYQLSADPAYRILAATQLPLVYESVADVEEWRTRLCNQIDKLIAGGGVQQLTERSATPVFSLAHQGCNDLEIQRRLGRLFVPAELESAPTEASCSHDKFRVGFVSSFFNSHTIGKLTRGLITRLSREKFHVTVFSVGRHEDTVAREIATSADRYVVLPRELALARQAILSNPVDVLVYTDIGMDPTTYSLAFSRLAPIQCATWGHPETTGLATIDYFVSSSLMETPEADCHYSERLVRLPSLTFFFHRSQLSGEVVSRAAFGLDPTARLYACPQSIYKFHPAFDAALAGVLRGDPEGQIVLIQWAYREADELLRRRFARVMPDVADRILFIRRMRQPEFMNFLTLVDVLLDPFPYGGGNSSLEAFSFGVPVVTLPTELLRGRITQAFCRRLGIEECIASDPASYVDIAVRLGRDQRFREEVSERILSKQKALFEDDSAVRDWERFLQDLRRGS